MHQSRSAKHVVLLGDSVFDSRPYLRGMPDMAARLETLLPGVQVASAAVSGSRIADIAEQLVRKPPDATHLIVSIGGNDLLDAARRLGASAGGVGQSLGRLTGAFSEFRTRYAAVCAQIAKLRTPAALCTIYEPALGDPFLRQLGSAALHVVNGTIQSEAAKAGLDMVDLRAICREPADFFDPIHPSARGADKIAAALAGWLQSGAGALRSTAVQAS